MQAKSRVRRSSRQWRDLIRQFEASGLSMAAFCRQRGVCYPSLCSWRKRLQDQHVASPSANLFQPLAVAAPSVPDRQSSGLLLSFCFGRSVSLSLRIGEIAQ
jgi:transposase-like protein